MKKLILILLVLVIYIEPSPADPFLVSDWMDQSKPVLKYKYFVISINSVQTFKSDPEFNEDGLARVHFDLKNIPDGEHRLDVTAINIFDKASETVTYWCLIGEPQPPTGLRVE